MTHKIKRTIFSAVTLSFLPFMASAQDVFSAQPCPNAFYQLPLFPEASLCQIFDDGLPASLTYHAKASQQQAQAFYEEKMGQADSTQLVKGRIQLAFNNSDTIIILSEDGSGTQVDVLVKNYSPSNLEQVQPALIEMEEQPASEQVEETEQPQTGDYQVDDI